jgi:hypothetical protein
MLEEALEVLKRREDVTTQMACTKKESLLEEKKRGVEGPVFSVSEIIQMADLKIPGMVVLSVSHVEAAGDVKRAVFSDESGEVEGNVHPSVKMSPGDIVVLESPSVWRMGKSVLNVTNAKIL